METSGREIEAKFLLPHLADIRARLLSAGGRLVSSRFLEVNLRFDDELGRFASAGRVLRLRRDRSAFLTYKAPGPTPEERTEIEVEIEDPEAGRRFLEAMGFRVVAAYEKYREVFSLGVVQVMLDELPFGHFVELEGNSVGAIQVAAERLGLVWEDRLSATYLDIFEAVRTRIGLAERQATFAVFERRPALPFADLDALARRARPLGAPA
jgi:adenylate cyclase class 2